MARDGMEMQVRTDTALTTAFTEATQREHTTPSDAVRRFMEQYVRDSLRREAARQSRLVAAAPDEAESMALLQKVQDFGDD